MSGLGIDQDFENGIRILRETHSKKVALKDAEIMQLRSELTRKENENKLQVQCARSDKRIAEMSRAVSKLASFKQAVMDSLANDDSGDSSELRRIQASAMTYSTGDLNGYDNYDNQFNGENTTRYGYSKASAGGYGASPERATEDILNSILSGNNEPSKSIKDIVANENLRRQQQQQQQSQQPSPPRPTTPGLGGQQPIINGAPAPAGVSSAGSAGAGASSAKRVTGLVAFESLSPQMRPSYLGGTGTTGQQSEPQYASTAGLGGGGHSGSVSPTAGSGAQVQSVDGREFFRNARALLSYDEFTALLANVKAYNNREQSRHRTLENLMTLLGDRHRDICEQFERLLAR
ncbi:hypothetical protein HK101_009756 [Irineochytrium annulatum]|nr:hypothetical protein HK101_009756 [Irineochytrium annulatum]